MEKRIVFRNMEHSDVMEDYAHQQLHKIEEFIEHYNTPHIIDLYLEPSHVHQHHRVALHVRFGSHTLDTSYEKEGLSFYDVLDHVIDVTYRRLHEEKRKYDDEEKTRGRHEEFKKER